MGKHLFGAVLVAVLLSAAGSDTRLADAAMQGDRAAVKSLLLQKVEVNGPQGDGATALHWAASNEDLEMVKLLLAAGANVNAATRDGGVTPLFMACTSGNAAIVEALLNAGASAKSAKPNGTTALMTASASGSVGALKALLDHGAEINARESVHGQTALMFAAALNRVEAVKFLAQHGADVNIASNIAKLERVRFDQDGNVVETPAGGAAAGGRGGRGGRGRGAAAAAPVQAPAKTADEEDAANDAEAAAAAAKTAKAAAESDLDLLARSFGLKSAEARFASPKAKAGDIAARAPRRVGAEVMGGMTALLYAAREGHTDTARALVEAGANVNAVSGDKYSPLVMAITNGHLDMAKYFLDHGADPNLATNADLPALYATIDVQWAPHTWFPQPSTDQEKITYLDLMKAEIDRGAKVNAQVGEKLWFRSFTNDYTWIDPAGATAFWRAAQSSDVAAMRLLVEHGADPKKPTTSLDTPLHAAAGIGWAANWSVNAPVPLVDAVKYCVELGNDVNALDNRGFTPLHGAAYLGNNEMVNYLVSKGAKVDVKSKAGDFAADMANGPTRFGQPHLETVALLEKLGSPNSHNCRSDQCVVQSKANIYNRVLTPAEQADKDRLDKLAVAMGFKEAEYLPDVPAAAGRGRGGK
jgi:ankyrin repeat protein